MDDVARLLVEQDGVISRRQALEVGLSRTEVARLLRRRDWTVVHEGVYVEHTGPLTWQQRAWAAVLFSWPAALSHNSALRAGEGPGRRGRDESVIDVAVHRDRNVTAPPGVEIHRMSGFDELAQWNLGPPRIRYDESVLDVAAAAKDDLAAVAVLADACGARRTTASRLLGRIEARAKIHRRAWLTSVLADVAEGTCSVLEHGYLDRVERLHGLPHARRQAKATSTGRPLYRDVEYEEFGLIVELDGRLFHSSPGARDRDLERDLDAAVENGQTVRIGFGQVFDRGCATAVSIGKILGRRGWTGSPTSCDLCGGSDDLG